MDCAIWGSDTAPQKAEATEETIQSEVLKLLKQDAGLLWVENCYDESMTAPMLEMISQIKDAYTVRFRSNDWMTEEEKQAALAKLDNMVAVVGAPTEENYVFPEIVLRADGGSYLTNKIALARRDLKKDLRLVNEPGYDRKFYGQALGVESVTATVVNAAANAQLNTFIITSSFIRYSASCTEDKASCRLLLLFVLGHEIGHLFDDLGNCYDEYGVLKNWWSDESHSHFQEIKQACEAHYKRFGIAEGMSQEFNGTVQELLGDYAGFQITLDIIGDDLQEQERFFRTLCTFMRSVSSKGKLELYADEMSPFTHPYGPVRCNPLITCADAFYKLYDVKEGDPMYTAPEDRLKLW